MRLKLTTYPGTTNLKIFVFGQQLLLGLLGRISPPAKITWRWGLNYSKDSLLGPFPISLLLLFMSLHQDFIRGFLVLLFLLPVYIQSLLNNPKQTIHTCYNLLSQ